MTRKKILSVYPCCLLGAQASRCPHMRFCMQVIASLYSQTVVGGEPWAGIREIRASVRSGAFLRHTQVVRALSRLDGALTRYLEQSPSSGENQGSECRAGAPPCCLARNLLGTIRCHRWRDHSYRTPDIASKDCLYVCSKLLFMPFAIWTGARVQEARRYVAAVRGRMASVSFQRRLSDLVTNYEAVEVRDALQALCTLWIQTNSIHRLPCSYTGYSMCCFYQAKSD